MRRCEEGYSTTGMGVRKGALYREVGGKKKTRRSHEIEEEQGRRDGGGECRVLGPRSHQLDRFNAVQRCD